MKDRKLKLSPLRLGLMFIPIYLLLQILLMTSLDFFDITTWPPTIDNLFLFYIYTPLLFVLTIIFYTISATQTYYYVDDKKITHHKMNKIFEYYFSEMLYIDEKWSKKHRTLLFYDKDGRRKFLIFDRDGAIYAAAVEKAKAMSVEEFVAHFPGVRL